MVRLEHRDDVAPGVVLITLDRPQRRNAVDHATLVELLRIQERVVDARVVVLTGAPPAFSAGADLTGVESAVFARDLSRVLRGFTRLPAPVVGAIDGPALGAGAQLAIVCDLRVATPDSVVGVPAARLGLMVDHWTVDRLVREFGGPIARAMLLAAETSTAEQLHRSGGIHRLGDLDAALGWAGEIAHLAPLSIAGHKLALEASAPAPAPDGQVQAAFDRAWASKDAIEGRRAFLDKRPAVFCGD